MTRRSSRRGSKPRIRVGEGRETDLRRVQGKREELTTFLVATNGECTEYDYINELKNEPWVKVGRVVVLFAAGSPVDVVRSVAKRRDRDDYDFAWAVCDVDNYEVEAAEQEAKESAVAILWSVPCFEVWLLLHKRQYTAYIENGTKADELLGKCVKRWDKARLNFKDFSDNIDDAVNRAKALGEPPAANPSTAMWRLIEALRSDEFGDGENGSA